MTTVFPEPVAIFEHSRLNAPPSEGMSMPTFAEAGASVSQINKNLGVEFGGRVLYLVLTRTQRVGNLCAANTTISEEVLK